MLNAAAALKQDPCNFYLQHFFFYIGTLGGGSAFILVKFQSEFTRVCAIDAFFDLMTCCID